MGFLMKIKITEADLEKANNSNSLSSVEIALRRYFGNSVKVSRDFVMIMKNKKCVKVSLPKKAQDAYLTTMWPHSFEFSLPDKDAKLLKG